jgi:hypothetical protein
MSRREAVCFTQMAGIESFDDVRGLGEVELRALLDGGRPEERVWALWALALRSAEESPTARNPTIAELARRAEPDPGVRRNLAVILAGHGQLELLVALAGSDPAPEVRGAAMALVARLAADGKLPATFVIQRATTDAPEVRTAVLGTIFASAPDWLADIADRLLGDRDADVRYEAFDALIRCGRTAIALSWLEEAPEPEARLTLMRWSARGRVRACAEQLANASRRLRRMLVESVRIASWDDLAPSIGDDPALIRALARRSGAAFDQIPLVALLRATLREPSDSWIVMVRDRLVRLDSPPPDLAPLLPDYRDMCAERITILSAHMTELRRAASDSARSEIEALDDERTALESALEEAARLLVH